MKRAYLLLSIFFCTSVFAQKFEFDLLTKYQSTTAHHSRESIVYANSKNSKYFLSIHTSPESKTARLYDLNKKIVHNFIVTESKNANELFFEFEYTDSKDIHDKMEYNKFQITHTTISTNDFEEEIKVDIYKNAKRKTPKTSLILKVKKSNASLFSLFRYSCMHPFEWSQNLDIPKKMIVESAKGKTIIGETITHKLLEYKETKFEIEVPLNGKQLF